jgi:RNase P protein component
MVTVNLKEFTRTKHNDQLYYRLRGRRKFKLTYAQRQRLPRSAFVYPRTRKYPIENIAHARNALARVARFGTKAEKRKVRLAVFRRYPSIDRGRRSYLESL